MRDDDVRTLFHRIGDGPPLGIDPQDVMSRGHRIRARRRWLAIAASTVAAAGATVLVALSAGGDQRPPEEVEPAGPSTTTSIPSTPSEQSPAPPVTVPPAPLDIPPPSAGR